MRGKDEDRDLLRGLNGMFVGLLDGPELEAFDRLVEAGQASYAYEGASGFMGLAKVSLAHTEPSQGEG